MVVDDLDLEGIPFAKLEADAPALVDGHCPPAFAVALELVQSDALQRAEVLQRFRDIQRQQQIGRRLEIGRSSSQTFRDAELRHDRIMAITYYAKR